MISPQLQTKHPKTNLAGLIKEEILSFSNICIYSLHRGFAIPAGQLSLPLNYRYPDDQLLPSGEYNRTLARNGGSHLKMQSSGSSLPT